MKLPKLVWILFLSSFFLRCVLVLLGGQNYSPDEIRYGRSLEFGFNLIHLGFIPALQRALSHADHTFFIFWGIIPAAIQHMIRLVFHIPTYETRYIGALFFSFFHALNIVLIYKLCLKLKMAHEASLLAGFLYFCSSVMLYYSRHLLPYDLALFLQLFALLLALNSSTHPFAFLLPSLLATFGFLTYNGFWALTPLVVLIPLLVRWNEGKFQWSQWLCAPVGPITLILGLVALAELLKVQPQHVQFNGPQITHLSPYLDGLLFFSSTVVQGLPREGWSLPFAYFWHAEHGLFLFWLFAAVVSLYQFKQMKSNARTFCLLMLLSLFFLINVPSTLLGKMVVYARVTKQFIPFFCILSASLACAWFQTHRRYAALALLLLTFNTVNNWIPIYTQSFPIEFTNPILKSYNPLSYAYSIKTNYDSDLPQKNQGEHYVLANIAYIWPVIKALELPQGKVLKKSAHPLEYKPYQYDGFQPEERKLLRETDISMKLIKTN